MSEKNLNFNRRKFLAAGSAVISAPVLMNLSGKVHEAEGAEKTCNFEIVKTDSGYVSGTVIGEPGNQAHVYRGIPYAAPPVGELRWKPPQPVKPWPEIRECTRYGKIPPQGSLTGPNTDQNAEQKNQQGEDCLYLNVVTPAKKPSDKLPVLIIFHGGGLEGMSANDDIYNWYRLPSNGLLTVSVSHRLGVIGLLAHPLLDAESENKVSGNYLFLDLIASLKWVKNNIAAFGGDPNNVTILGGSGGGWKVCSMLASPLAKGLVHKAVVQSGGGFNGTPLKEIENSGETLFAKLGITTLKEARALPWKDILEASSTIPTPKDRMSLWNAAIDGWFLPDEATKLFASGKYNGVVLMVGANQGELAGLGGMMNMIPYYVDLLNATNRAGFKGYAYIFDKVSAGSKAQGGVSEHGSDIPYFFGDYDCSIPTVDWDPAAKLQTKTTSNIQVFDAADKQVSLAIMAMLAGFCATGDPSVKGPVKWPAWESTTDQYMYLADPPAVKTGYSHLMDNISS